MEFIQENAWVFTVVIGGLAIVIAIGTIIFKFAMWMQKINSDRDTLRADSDTLRADSDTFKDFMKEIREDIKKIHEKINKILGHIDKTTVSSGSPLHLTELGEKISGEIQARQWAEKTATEFTEKVRDKQPYEIQEICFEHVREKFKPDSDLDSKIGTAAYENGIKRDEVLNVLAIELRDVLMAYLNKPDNFSLSYIARIV